jgi:hypothetical protein
MFEFYRVLLPKGLPHSIMSIPVTHRAHTHTHVHTPLFDLHSRAKETESLYLTPV